MKNHLFSALAALFAAVVVVACGKEPQGGEGGNGVELLKLSPSSYEFSRLGQTKALSVTVRPLGYSLEGMVFTSDNNAVATVDQDGVVTAVANGKATITGSLGGKKATCSITVNEIEGLPTAMSFVSPSEGQNVAGGETIKVEVSFEPEDAIYKDYTLTVSEGKGIVDKDEITFNNVDGEVTITATNDKDHSLKCSVTVNCKSHVEGLEIKNQVDGYLYVAVGKTGQVEVKVIPETTSNKECTFRLSNPEVATVDDKGIITGIKVGTAMLTVTSKEDESIKATCPVSVVSKVNYVSVNGESAVAYFPGTLSNVIGGRVVTSLVWTQPSTMEGNDVDALKDRCVYDNLQSIDFGKVTFVASGNKYRYHPDYAADYWTSDFTVPRAFCRDNYKLESAVISADAKVIENGAFGRCYKLKSISIPSSVETIKQYAFDNSGLEGTLTLPASVKMVESGSFYRTKITKVVFEGKSTDLWLNPFTGCLSLEEFVVPDGSEYLKAIDGLLYENNGTTLRCIPCKKVTGSFTLPSCTKVLAEGAIDFSGMSIGEFNLNEGLEQLDHYSCPYYPNETLTLPSTLKVMSYLAITSGYYTKLIVKATVPPVVNTDNVLFLYAKKECKEIRVPAASVDAYKAAPGWRNHADIIKAIE